ncbi:MAG TPA: flavodoxin family protein [Clostridia bacterium]|nr:flavodoxin family protein [Clostridia bacterium]
MVVVALYLYHKIYYLATSRAKRNGDSMRVSVFMGSPRLNGNTAELCKPFIDELKVNRAEVSYTTLRDKKIAPCKACYACQQVSGEYGCVQHDDMQAIVDEIIKSDVIVLATPIYTWYCTPEMKAMLDRHYGLNKFYGKGSGSLWAGKGVAIIATHGYDRAYATEPFETGIKRLCEHSKLNYMGMYSARDVDDLASFKASEATDGAREFARTILDAYPANL